jgi:hypothetical protein
MKRHISDLSNSKPIKGDISEQPKWLDDLRGSGDVTSFSDMKQLRYISYNSPLTLTKAELVSLDMNVFTQLKK